MPSNAENYLLTVMGSLRGELIGRKSVDWYTPISSSAVLHLGARCVKGSLGSLAQYLHDKKSQGLNVCPRERYTSMSVIISFVVW